LPKNFGRQKAALVLIPIRFMIDRSLDLLMIFSFKNFIDGHNHCIVKNYFKTIIILQCYLSLLNKYIKKLPLDFGIRLSKWY